MPRLSSIRDLLRLSLALGKSAGARCAPLRVSVILNSPDIADSVCFARSFKARSGHVFPSKWEQDVAVRQAKSAAVLASAVKSSDILLAADGAADALLELHAVSTPDELIRGAIAAIESSQTPEIERHDMSAVGASSLETPAGTAVWLPHAVIGDFDSIRGHSWSRLLQLAQGAEDPPCTSKRAHTPMLLCRSESQDENDLFKCLAIALECAVEYRNGTAAPASPEVRRPGATGGEHEPGAAGKESEGAVASSPGAAGKESEGAVASSPGAAGKESEGAVASSPGAAGKESEGAGAVAPGCGKEYPVDQHLEQLLRKWDTSRMGGDASGSGGPAGTRGPVPLCVAVIGGLEGRFDHAMQTVNALHCFSRKVNRMVVLDRSSCLRLVPEGRSTVSTAPWMADGVGLLPLYPGVGMSSKVHGAGEGARSAGEGVYVGSLYSGTRVGGTESTATHGATGTAAGSEAGFASRGVVGGGDHPWEAGSAAGDGAGEKGDSKTASAPVGVSTRGLQWDLSPALDLRFGAIVSSSNRLAGQTSRTEGVDVHVPTGRALIWSADVLPLELARLSVAGGRAGGLWSEDSKGR